jgi:hypothetical protein
VGGLLLIVLIVLAADGQAQNLIHARLRSATAGRLLCQ